MPDNKPTPRQASASQNPVCFVIMPIGDHEGYTKGHFRRVYDDIIRPACVGAGFSPIRADEVKQTNLIHLDILQKLIESPMAVCDLSTRNPNVLFELALRQAFDMPVSLIQEVGTPTIFDISPFRYTEYRKERIYHEVLEDQKAIADAISETFKSHETGRGINSIVKLLALSKPANLPDIGSPEAKEDLQKLILAEITQLRDEVRWVRRETRSATINRRSIDSLNADIDTVQMTMQEAEALLMTDNEATYDRVEMLLTRSLDRLTRMKYLRTDDARMIVDRLDYLRHELAKRRDVLQARLKQA